jgi:hypothetical protein
VLLQIDEIDFCVMVTRSLQIDRNATVLDDSEEFGFVEDNVAEECGTIPMDKMHVPGDVYPLLQSRVR